MFTSKMIGAMLNTRELSTKLTPEDPLSTHLHQYGSCGYLSCGCLSGSGVVCECTIVFTSKQ